MSGLARRRAGLAVLVFAAVAAVAALWPRAGDGDLVIYSAMGPPGTMIPAFEAASGLHATYINMAGGPLQARIYAEGSAPRWTVAWFVGDAAMAALDAAGLLARHLDVGPSVAWTKEAQEVMPADGAYVPTGLTLAGVFLTRGQTAPPDWPGLTSVAGGVGLVSPVTSGTAYPVLSAMMVAVGGPEPGHALLQKLAGQGLSVAPTNPLLLAQVRRREVALAILPSQAAYVLAAREPAFTVRVPQPAGLMPAVIAVSARASPAAQAKARQFIAFLLTPAGQLLIRQSTAEGYSWPVVAEAAAPAGLPDLRTLALLHPDPVTWGSRQGAEIGWFRREIAP